jgi:hypothetical protein
MRNMKAISALVIGMAAAGCDGLFSPDAESRGHDSSVQALSATSVLEGAYHADATITCTVTVATTAVSCASPQDPNPALPPTIGGRGIHARLIRKSGVYIPDSAKVRINMKVRNLLYQAIGTADGNGLVTGIKAFFHELPVTTGGTGTVTVANADGTAEFTALNQPYFLYPQMLKSTLSSAHRPWVFNVPATVTQFRFRIAISANILPLVVFDKLGVDGNRDIYRVNLDGSQLVRLTSNVSVESSPTVAKDRVVFVSYRDGNANLFSVGLGGGQQTRLTNTGWDETEPALSSDGLRLAYVSNQSGTPRIMHAAADGTNPQALAAYGYAGNVPSSPTWIIGADPRVAYASSANGEVDILKVRISGGTTTRALTTPTRPNIEPSFNADGTKMTYVRPVSGNIDVFVHDVATNTNTRLTTWVRGDIQPTFTHDGRIVWLSEMNDGSYTIRWMSDDGVNKFNVGSFDGDPSNPFGVPLQ